MTIHGLAPVGDVGASTPPDAPARSRRGRRLAAMAAGVAALGTAFGVGYAVGEGSHGTRVLTGTAYAGDHVATWTVGGWAYGVRESVAWTDGDGVDHDSGWPECLRSGGTSTIRFAETPVAVRGRTTRAVTWVDCRG